MLDLSPDWQDFHARGWNSFGLPNGSKVPASAWKEWQSVHTAPDDHRRWQAAGMNAALVTGAISGLVVLDCDSPEAAAEAERLGIGNAPRVDTARGAHFYFRHPGGKISNKVGLRPGMDLRADGGFVVAPGSVHPSGARYRWHRPPEGDLPPLPDWVLAPDRPAPLPPSGAAQSTPYGEAALQSEIEIMRTAPDGTRNHQLNKSAFALAQLAYAGDIDEGEAKAVLSAAALEAGLESHEVDATLASGWMAGLSAPRAVRAALVGKVPAAPVGNTPAAPRIIRADELDAMAFAPLQWAIPAILPEGLTLLAGKPKAGKSYLAMQVAMAIASGSFAAFGAPDAEGGEALYLALEDSNRRLQDRMQSMLMGPKPAGLHFATNWPRLDQGCIAELAQWCDQHPKTRLIIIDTLRTIKAPTKGRQSSYDEDASSVAPLHEFTKSRPGLAVIVVHHTRKQESADVFDLISGTHGLSGVFDSLVVLAKDATGATTLSAQGRDLEPYSKALERDQRTGGWLFVGEAAPRAKTGERQELLDLLIDTAQAMPLAALAQAVGKGADTTRRLLIGLMEEGLVCQPKHGSYQLVPSSNHSIQSISNGVGSFSPSDF